MTVWASVVSCWRQWCFFFPVEKSIHNIRWATEWLLVGTKRREFCMLAAKPRVQAHWQRGPDCWHQFINQTGSVPVWRARLDFPQVSDQQTPQGKRIRLFNLFVHFQKESWISWFSRVHGDQYMAASKPAANQTVGSLADGGAGRTTVRRGHINKYQMLILVRGQ